MLMLFMCNREEGFYDYPKDLIKGKGCFILIKAIIVLFFGGIIFALIRAKKAINDFNNHGIREPELAKHLKL